MSTEEAKPITAGDIRRVIERLGGFGSIMIPEFTWGDLRIDALVMDTKKRWARGFEIKVSRTDFLRDIKWTEYAFFCSSLSVACPAGLIKKEEVGDPFGLLYINRSEGWDSVGGLSCEWAKRPKNYQRRNSLAWLHTYTRILEQELPRLNGAVETLRNQLSWAEGNVADLRKELEHARIFPRKDVA